jgi:hypothetical protein
MDYCWVNKFLSMLAKNIEKELIPQFKTIRSYIPSEEVQKRQSKIFEQLKEERERLEREADAESRRQEAEYEERERKAKEADEAIRRTVQRARLANLLIRNKF